MSAVHLELTLAIKAPALIICTEQRSIYINTFPNTLTSEWAKNHDIRICFSANTFVGLCHAPP